MPQVKVLKAHRWAEQGRMVEAGETIDLDEGRYRALLRSGLVEPLPQDVGTEAAQPARQVGVVTHGSTRQPRRERLTARSGAGPTIGEWVAVGYLAKNYPPKGYESRSTAAEIEAAIAAQAEAEAAHEKSEK